MSSKPTTPESDEMELKLRMLHSACERGSLTELEKLVDKWKDLDINIILHSETALDVAVRHSRKNIVKFLISKGAEVNIRNARGRTPLYLACSTNNKEIATLLLENGADINCFGTENNSLLFYASYMDLGEMVRLLLEHGENVNIRSYTNGDTPLHKACQENALNAIEVLLDQGANVALQNFNGDTPLMVAITCSCEESMSLIIRKCNITTINTNLFGEEPLHQAAMCKSLKTIKTLIGIGANPNLVSDSQNLPLHLVFVTDTFCSDELVEITKILVNLTENINYQDDRGMTPLHYFLIEERGSFMNPEEHKNNCLKILKLLLKKKADINCQNYVGETPAHLIQIEYMLALVLLYSNPDLIIQNYNGETVRQALVINKINVAVIEAELSSLKRERFCSGYSMKDIVYMNSHSLSRFSKNQMFIDIGNGRNSLDCFPNYKFVIQEQVRKANKRRHLMDSTFEILKLKLVPKLLPEVFNDICEFLTNNDIEHFNTSLSNI